MAGPWVPDLALDAATNEAFYRSAFLTNPDGTPVDLTGAAFSSQAKLPAINTEVLCDITISAIGDPALGEISFAVPLEVMGTLEQQDAYYDVLYTASGGQPQNLWRAPFRVVTGISA